MNFTEELYKACAEAIGCEIATFKAIVATIAEIESDCNGFTPSGRVMCRFEGHVFYRQTHGKYKRTHPTLCYPRWNSITQKYSLSNPDEEYVQRFSKAFGLNPDAAIQATSWGLFQIMGFHFKILGFKTPGQMLDFLKDGIENHLLLFTDFLNHRQNRKMKKALLDKNWNTFATLYNGPDHEKNNYVDKIEKNYLIYV